MKTTCLHIEVAILREFNFRTDLIVPGITSQMCLVPFEVDMLVLRNSGCAIGFEIKVTKADLKKDLDKKHIKNSIDELGILKYFGKFKEFYYAVPSELEKEALSQIPDFVGLYVFTINEYTKLNTFKKVRNSKYLSRYQWSDKEQFEVARLGTMRIKNLKEKLLTKTSRSIGNR